MPDLSAILMSMYYYPYIATSALFMGPRNGRPSKQAKKDHAGTINHTNDVPTLWKRHLHRIVTAIQKLQF